MHFHMDSGFENNSLLHDLVTGQWFISSAATDYR